MRFRSKSRHGPTRPSGGRCPWALVLGSLLVPGGCAAPSLAVRVEPKGSELFVDGRRGTAPKDPTGITRVSWRYYGTTSLSARRPAVYGDTGEWMDRVFLEQRQQVTVPEPFSPWLFPLDFVLECVTYPFASGTRYGHEAAVALPRQPESVGGIPPRELPALSTRARQAREAR